MNSSMSCLSNVGGMPKPYIDSSGVITASTGARPEPATYVTPSVAET